MTDKNFRPCKCGYQICLFCYNKIKDNHNGACPACRTPYDDANAVFVTPDPSEVAKMAKEKKAKELKEFNDKMAAPAKHEAKAREDIKLAEAAHAAQIAEATKANAAMAVRVAVAQAKLKAAEGGLGALAAKHQKEAGEAAGAASAAAAAHALKNLKNDTVKIHQEQRNATAKKIESMQMQ